MELRKKPCPPYLVTRKISLMETGSMLIRATAVVAQSRLLHETEKHHFADVLQAPAGVQVCSYSTASTSCPRSAREVAQLRP